MKNASPTLADITVASLKDYRRLQSLARKELATITPTQAHKALAHIITHSKAKTILRVIVAIRKTKGE